MPQLKRIRTVEGSCWKCKDRRVICDLKKPCSKCSLGNFECSYGKRIRYQLFKPLVQKLKEVKKEEKKLVERKVMKTSKEITIQKSPACCFNMNLKMMYFEQILSPKLTVYGASMRLENTSIFRDPMLSSFVEAVSSAHRMIETSDDSSIDIVNSSRNSAINGFKEKILNLSKANMNVLFVGNVFLCLLDGVIYPKVNSKIACTHLQGGRALLKQLGTPERLLKMLNDPISVMMLSYFGTIDLTNCILTGTYPFFGKDFWSFFGDKEAWWGNISEGDSFLEILGGLAEIGRAVLEAENIPLPKLLLMQSFFERMVRKATPNSDPWDNFCSAFSLAALIYIYRMICGVQKDDDLIQRAVADCVENIRFLKDNKLQHCLLFPLSIVGCHCSNSEQQESIIQSVFDSYEHLKFGSVEILRDFLQDKWYGTGNVPSWVEDFKLVSEIVFLF